MGPIYGVWIRYAVEGTPLGTGGAFKNAEEHIDSTTVVFNGDVLTSLDLSRRNRTHRERGAVATLVLTPVDNPSAYGLVETRCRRLGPAIHRKARARMRSRATRSTQESTFWSRPC